VCRLVGTEVPFSVFKAAAATGEDWRAGRLDNDEILARLFALNQSRSTVKK
jgi:hypothetical protein